MFDLKFRNGSNFSVKKFIQPPGKLTVTLTQAAQTDLHQFQTVGFETSVPLGPERISETVNGVKDFRDHILRDLLKEIKIFLFISLKQQLPEFDLFDQQMSKRPLKICQAYIK